MENSSADTFLIFWHNAMMVGAIIMALSGIVIYIVHKIKISTLKEYKEKYDYISQKEIKNYKLIFLCLGLSVAMFINLYGRGELTQMGVWFLVRLFISIAGGTLIGYVAFLILDYYYPMVVAKELNKWRYMPRVNPKTGNTMRLLSEEEEDVHLEEGMKAEEDIFSVDYDVWVDEKSGDVRVEKYAGNLQALQCNSCGFFTMKVVREEIAREPVNGEPGELIKHYQCSYCKSIRATSFRISTKDADDYKGAPLERALSKDKRISLIKIEIHSNSGGKKFFEFQNVDQAQKFLEEYESKA